MFLYSFDLACAVAEKLFGSTCWLNFPECPQALLKKLGENANVKPG